MFSWTRPLLCLRVAAAKKKQEEEVLGEESASAQEEAGAGSSARRRPPRRPYGAVLQTPRLSLDFACGGLMRSSLSQPGGSTVEKRPFALAGARFDC